MVAQLQDVHELEESGFFPKDERPMGEALGNTLARASVVGYIDGRHVSQITEFAWLMRREAIAMKRDKMFLIARFIQATIMSLMIGIIFLNVGERDPDVPIVSENDLSPSFMFNLTPPAQRIVGSSKYLRSDGNGLIYEYHGYGTTYALGFPAGATRLFARVLDESLFCILLLHVALCSRSVCHCYTSFHHGYTYILPYCFPGKSS